MVFFFKKITRNVFFLNDFHFFQIIDEIVSLRHQDRLSFANSLLSETSSLIRLYFGWKVLAYLYDALPFGSVTRDDDLVYDDHLDNPVTILLVAMTTLSQFDSFCGEDAKLRRRVFFTRHGQQLRQQLQHRVRWLQWNCIVKRMKTRASSTEAQPRELRARTFNNELNVHDLSLIHI